HLSRCEQCSERVQSLRDTAAALAYVPEGPAPPPALRERVLQRVHEQRRGNVVPLRRRIALPAAVSFAAAATAAAIARVLGDPAAAHIELGVSSRVVVGSSGEAVLVSRLAPAPAGKTYELWVITGGTPRPAGLFADGARSSP